MVCARQIIEEMPNDLVRRNPAKYTSQYINRLMSMIPNWKRSDQEKVKGLHPAYCDKTGRAKHPWVRVDAPNEEVVNRSYHFKSQTKGKEEYLSLCPSFPLKKG